MDNQNFGLDKNSDDSSLNISGSEDSDHVHFNVSDPRKALFTHNDYYLSPLRIESDVGFVNAGFVENDYAPFFETENPVSTQPSISDVYDFIISAATIAVDENSINEKRMKELKDRFTPQLVNLILNSDFEYGMDSEVDTFVINRMSVNASVTKSWLSEIYVENFSRPEIIIGLLRAISRLPYKEILPEGPIMAVSAFSHNDTEVKECGVRAFENWGDKDSISILQNLKVSPVWLQDYINKVIQGLLTERAITS